MTSVGVLVDQIVRDMLYILQARHPHWHYEAVLCTTTIDDGAVEVEFRYPPGNKCTVKAQFTPGNFVGDSKTFSAKMLKELEKLGAEANGDVLY